MKYQLRVQHYFMPPGSIWYDAGPCVPQPGQGESRVVTAVDGDRTEGSLIIVPVEKLELIE
jgi:hypothetical protein